MAGLLDTINAAADRSGLDADYLARIAKIESGMNPRARTGSYHGLFQLSPSEFRRYGGTNIYDAADNARTAAAMMADQRNAFTAKYGRPPSPTEAYMVHQQGAAGLDAHLANPDRPAWENMLSTGEGRQKGAGWAKAAIWGNIPDYLKPQFGNVNNVTSDAFINQVWRPKVEGGNAEAVASGSPAGLPVQADQLPAAQMAAGSPAGLPGQYASAGAAAPSGSGLFGSQLASAATPGAADPYAALTKMGMGMLQAPQMPAVAPMQLPTFPQLQMARPQVDYSGLQRLLAGRSLTPLTPQTS